MTTVKIVVHLINLSILYLREIIYLQLGRGEIGPLPLPLPNPLPLPLDLILEPGQGFFFVLFTILFFSYFLIFRPFPRYFNCLSFSKGFSNFFSS